MPDPFAHLHVASGYSLRYGVSMPHTLVERAASLDMDLLALTDRDATYGAVKFAQAAQDHGIRPVLGVDLAVSLGVSGQNDEPARRTPARGGLARPDARERVVLLAHGSSGWAALCRLVSEAHVEGERGKPVATPRALADHLSGGEVSVLLGPWSGVGHAVARGDRDAAEQEWEMWRDWLPSHRLHVELVSHLRSARPGAPGAQWMAGSTAHAARMARFAAERGASTVLTNAVRHADRVDAVTADVLDSARRLVPLDARHVDRGNAEGYLKPGTAMRVVADEVMRAAGDERGAGALLERTRRLAEEAALDPKTDLGLGSVHFPEFEVVRRASIPVVGVGATPADVQLRARCEAGVGWRYGSSPRQRIWKRLDDELRSIETLGFASYFLAVGEVTDLVREMGIRVAARGSGAGSLVTHLLGISGVDPLRHGLLMERFVSPLRASLPDIDIDVESARRTDVYDAVFERFGAQRCVTVSMAETYRVRHAIRDVGQALGMPPAEVDALAKAFPRVRARDVRSTLSSLPELRASGIDEERLRVVLALVERLDGLPRSIAMHPCGIILSDATLLDRTPVESSGAGYPMSHFDKDDVDALGMLKLDVLGIRMQSAMAHAVSEISRVNGVEVDVDDADQVPLDDPATYALINTTRTLGVFQIESPGQRELVGKSGIDDFEEIVTDVALFRPGPVQGSMIEPYLEVKQGWRDVEYLHPDLAPVLASTRGVVVFHEQVIESIAIMTGASFDEAERRRRRLGSDAGKVETKEWFVARALARGYEAHAVARVWEVLEGFAAFGFCKAHAAAFALPTFQSAWLKTHWPAHFLSGVLTHDPGMYPKRLILDDARHFGVGVRGVDVNRSEGRYTVEKASDERCGHAIRLSLAEVKGISGAEVDRIVASRPYVSLDDFWHRARVSRPVAENLVLVGAFDQLHEIGTGVGLTRRDLLLRIGDLERSTRAEQRGRRGRGVLDARRSSLAHTPHHSVDLRQRSAAQVRSLGEARSAGESGAEATVVESVQLALDVDADQATTPSGLPEMDQRERTAAELEILGLDVSAHVVDPYLDLMDALGVVRSVNLLTARSSSEIWVAGVKVATQTPPVKSGRRVVFLTLDDSTGPVDATFFSDVQADYAATVFSSWKLLVRGVVRRTGPRGVSVRATGAWPLDAVKAVHESAGGGAAGLRAVQEFITTPAGGVLVGSDEAATARASAEVRGTSYHGTPLVAAGAGTARSLWHRSQGSPG